MFLTFSKHLLRQIVSGDNIQLHHLFSASLLEGIHKMSLSDIYWAILIFIWHFVMDSSTVSMTSD